jgi:hypothetical protein
MFGPIVQAGIQRCQGHHTQAEPGRSLAPVVEHYMQFKEIIILHDPRQIHLEPG